MMDLKKFIRVARAKKGMSQKQLAEASGVSECSICFIEIGKIKPRMTTLVKLAKALDVDEDEILNYLN